MAEELKYWIGLNAVSGIGPVRFKQLLDRMGNAAAAWFAPRDELKAAGLDEPTIQNLERLRREMDLDAELQKIAQLGARVLTWDDPAYPARLTQIHDPPPVLFMRGELSARDEWAVAVVGTRSPKPYGKQVVEEIAGDLARAGITVVSGLARGIDALAHRAALEAGGRTLAVLGSGIDILYPAENTTLADTILERGALISEYPLGMPPEAGNFPRRNRLISGLSLGVVVIEAGENSGALITADYALEQGRELFAVPGNITSPKSRGTNKLIQEGGAKLILSVADILEELNLTLVQAQREVREVAPENEAEAVILEQISQEPVHVDEIGRETGLPIAQVTGALALMELKGLVRQVGGMHYVLAREAKLDYVVD